LVIQPDLVKCFTTTQKRETAQRLICHYDPSSQNVV